MKTRFVDSVFFFDITNWWKVKPWCSSFLLILGEKECPFFKKLPNKKLVRLTGIFNHLVSALDLSKFPQRFLKFVPSFMIVYHVDQTLNGDLGKYPFNETKSRSKRIKNFEKKYLLSTYNMQGRRKVWKPGEHVVMWWAKFSARLR